MLSEPAQLLVQAVAALRAQVPTDLPDARALAETAVVLRELDRLRVVALTRVADVDVRQLHALDAAPSTSSWVETRSTGLGRDDVALARKLSRMPSVAAQVDAGLPLASAIAIGRALDKVRRSVDRPDARIGDHDGEMVLESVIVAGVLFQLAEARGGWPDDDPDLQLHMKALTEVLQRPAGQLARLEAAFVHLAVHLERQLLGQALDRLVDAVLPQRLEHLAEAAHARRGLVLTPHVDGPGGRISRGDLDAECFAYLQTVLTAAQATDPANPHDTAAHAAVGDPVAGGDGHLDLGPEPRSRAQQAHDALRLGLRRLLDSGAMGTRAKAAPHLLVTVPLAALHDEPGALPAVTAHGTALPAGLTRRLLCDSRLTRAVLGLGRRVLELSHSQRTLTAAERTALHLQWGGRCAGAGCTSPPGTPLIPHHADPWHKSGTTSLDDTVPVCAQTHHDLHGGQRTIRLRDGRCLGPDGWAQGPSG